MTNDETVQKPITVDLEKGLKPVAMTHVADGLKPAAMTPVVTAEDRGLKPVPMTSPTQPPPPPSPPHQTRSNAAT